MGRKKKDEGTPDLFVPEPPTVPKMPEGFYSGDKPNPNLRNFVEEHVKERPYDPEHDSYDVPAFDKPIETTKATAIYNMHTYWSKKPHDAIRQYIRHYTQPGDLVLDPFCGSGGTALAALMEGRKAIAIDRSPAATFITKNYCTPVSPEGLKKAFEELKARVQPEMDWLYETKCDRCGGKATTGYTVYSQVFQCPRCMEKVPLFDCEEVSGETAAGKPKKISACPHCKKRGVIEEISTRGPKFGAIPVLVSYLCESGCKPTRGERRHNDPDRKKQEYFEKFDLGKLQEIDRKEIPCWFPRDRMMHAPEDQECWGVKWRAGTSNFRTVDELFTKRNLWALATIRENIKLFPSYIGDPMLFSLSGILLGMSRMNRFRPDVSYPTNVLEGTYYLPQIMEETKPLKHFENKLGKIIKAYSCLPKDLLEKRLAISTESACEVEALPGDSVDLIFTDPPYADKVQYGELNFIWEAWLGFDTHWHVEEIIVNEVRGKTEADWANMMRKAMAECYRVLKPGRWISLCYHDTSEGTWALVQDIMAEAGFIVDKTSSAVFIDTDQKSYNQLVADKVTKRDLVVNFRKPKPQELGKANLRSDSAGTTFSDMARGILTAFLADNPGATKDRIYDHLVSMMVQAGRMESHDFEGLLRQVADEVREPVKKNLFENKDPDLFGTHEISRWYLKETALSVKDEAESRKEDAAAKSLEAFMTGFLAENPGEEGVHYSDMFEHFLFSVHEKPRRSLADWLPDYFFKTESGTWRPPENDDERKLKREGRVQGLSRRIRRFLGFILQGMAVPEKERPSSQTLAEWIRHCKMSGRYEEGKLLFEKGGIDLTALDEQQEVDVEADYNTCKKYFLQGPMSGPKKAIKPAKAGTPQKSA